MKGMQSQENLNSASVEEVVKRIFINRKITRADQRRFMAAMMSKDALTVEEHEQIDRVFDGLRRGVLRVVD
ncbi:hypothetical protein [Kamptonema sp. UHCC 0994]|uniref:hypothetical protein n=1 Tax=Kamptonema sp. UHCC 0994 TaxID=3031329 RepID=UPI0023B9DB5E|nr:hypothetical protein [Kamptonema sp. UHCC 0994]MDF0555113.1 hypothetical protein [Kamptonema sp. UHCC 0994]